MQLQSTAGTTPLQTAIFRVVLPQTATTKPLQKVKDTIFKLIKA